MKKEINKKLKLNKIDWAEVLDALNVKEFENFTDSDIKRALKKTGRNFNNNGPFHSTVKDFLKTLGNTADTKLIRGEKIYTIISLKDAYIMAGRKQREKEPVVIIPGPIVEEVKEEKKPEEPEENKIKDLFKRSYSPIQNTLCLLAVFIKHGKNKISGHDFKNDYEILLGNSWNTLMTSGKPEILKILRRLEYGSLEIKKTKDGSLWELKLSIDILDAYIRLSEIYKKLSNKDPRNLDDYISSKESRPVIVVDKFKELQKEQKKRCPVFREESTQARWEKWLLLTALRSYQCAPTKVCHLVDWVRINRYEDISENQALRLLREMQSDYEGSITFQPGDRVSLEYEAGKILCKQYDPKKLEETIYVKLRLTPEDLQNFQDLVFTVEESLGEGKYLYEIKVNRSYASELCLKNLMKFIRICGKIYSQNSFMLERVKKILNEEENAIKTKENNIRIYENF